ncbi:Uncharacterised protein [Raoultella terrigena]|jgi:hypothetical protein|uniref:hypothetical protein n=1 Tax=Raoultella terrigena TaxID=577 RepID=UPI001162587E|nr:hypothetical protein [Raoultella terrigena]VUC76237.1 Uncharacterised protein [Raoultella terrigena]
MSRQNVKPVLLSHEQIKALSEIREQHRKASNVGVAPTIHEIARGLIDKALASLSDALQPKA